MKNLVTIDPLIKIRKVVDLIDEPYVIHVQNFNEEAAIKFSADLNKAHSTGQKIIPIIIDSFGGYVYSCLSMVTELQHASLPIATIALGKAMSCGSVLLSCGHEGYRFVAPNATVMLHEVSSHECGKNQEIQASAKETARLNKYLFQLMAKNCGHTDKNYFLNEIYARKNADWFLTPADAVKHKLANKVHLPHFATTISVNTIFC